MPRACPAMSLPDATGLSRGASRLLAIKPAKNFHPDATALCRGGLTFVANALLRAIAESVNLHGTSPWHLNTLLAPAYSSKREVPRDKPVASQRSISKLRRRSARVPRACDCARDLSVCASRVRDAASSLLSALPSLPGLQRAIAAAHRVSAGTCTERANARDRRDTQRRWPAAVAG